MSRTVLTVERVGKSYVDYGSNLKRFASWFGVKVARKSEYWAVHDVTFELAAGDTLGVIGQNGAGKSTLLKLITGTVRPTTGKIAVAGRVSAILELGLGFNPEFSGRQNVYQAGGLMGMSERDLTGLMPEIEEFSELGEFFDHPLRTYSSGMQARLAFSLATAVRPDLLIVDEALAVGDMRFQRKCFQRIDNYKNLGTTILLVTHETETVKRLCEKAIWLDRGRTQKFGRSKEVCEAYEKKLLGDGLVAPHTSGLRNDSIKSFNDPSLPQLMGMDYGDGSGYIIDFWIENASGERINVVPTNENFVLRYHVKINTSCSNVHFGMMIKTIEGITVYATHTTNDNPRCNAEAGDEIAVSFAVHNALVPGNYAINCGTNHETDTGREVMHRRIDVAILKVVPSDPHVVCAGLANLSAVASLAIVGHKA